MAKQNTLELQEGDEPQPTRTMLGSGREVKVPAGPQADKPWKSAQDILGINDITYEDIYVPEWDTNIRIRGLMVAERDRWERLASGKVTADDAKFYGGVKLTINHTRALVVQMCALDRDGGKMFPNPADVIKLSKKSSAAIDRLFTAIIKLSKVEEDDVAEIEAAFEEGPTTVPSTTSRGNSGSGT